MSAEQGDTKTEIGFSEWFGLVCKHDPLAYPQLLCMILLVLGASFLIMYNAIVGFPLFLGLSGAFMLALHRAWHRSLENPPWYLKEWGTGHARTDDD